jgi:hypothetical protein
MNKTIELKDGFTQVCVWPGTTLDESTPDDFVKFFKERGFRVQYLEEIETSPDYDQGRPIEGTGGRIDQLFAIHDDDIKKFAIPRFNFGIRWVEDVIRNAKEDGSIYIYPDHIREYCKW